MRKNIFKTMFIAAAAFAFASCSKDATTDLTPSRELSGLKKTISLNAGFAGETRTELSADHKLTWSEDDVFGILAADAQGVLGNIAVAIASGEKAEGGYYFEGVEVPAETTTLYCYYPYSDTYDKLTDIGEFTVNIPNFYSNDTAYSSYGYCDESYAGEFLPEFHYMAAAAEVTGEDATVKFKPLVSIIEFNLYDSTNSGEKFNNFYFAIDKAAIAGTFSVNFSENSLTATDGESALTWIFTAEAALSLKDKKEDGTKLYAIVPKGEYDNATLTLGSTDHEFQGGYFNDLEWENGTSFTADGHTVNIDLKHALPTPLVVPGEFTQAEGNPYFATTYVTLQQACDFFAITVMTKAGYETAKKIVYEDGTNSIDRDIEQLYNAFTAYTKNGDESLLISQYGATYNVLPYYPFEGYFDEKAVGSYGSPRILTIDEDWMLQYNGYWNSETHAFDKPRHTVLDPDKDYVFIAYAKADPALSNGKYDEDRYVYTYNFHTPKTEFLGSGTLEITDYEQNGSVATAKIKGTNVKKVVSWVIRPGEYFKGEPTTTKDGVTTPPTLTADDLTNGFTNHQAYFVDYEDGLTFTQDKMNPGDTYWFCAAGVDEDGKLIAATPLAVTAADIELDGYEISEVSLASQPTKLGEVELTFTVKDSPKYLRIYTSAPINIDGQAGDPQTGQTEIKPQTWDEIQGYFKDNTSMANYKEVEVTGNTITTTVTFAENDQIMNGFDWVDNPGHNPIYIFIVGADAKGDAVTKLGNIYQICGEYDSPIVEKCEGDIHRGTDSNYNVVDKDAYFYSCPVDQFAEEEPEDKAPALFAGYATTPSLMSMANAVYVYATGATGKGWLFKLGSKNEHSEWGAISDAANDALKSAVKTALNAAFVNYLDDGSCSSEYLKHEFNPMPGSMSAGTFSTPVAWFNDAAVGDVYLIVYDCGDAKTPLYGCIKTLSGETSGRFTIAANGDISGSWMND